MGSYEDMKEARELLGEEQCGCGSNNPIYCNKCFEKQKADYKLKVSKDWIKTKELFAKQIFKELDNLFYEPSMEISHKKYLKVKAKFLQERIEAK